MSHRPEPARPRRRLAHDTDLLPLLTLFVTTTDNNCHGDVTEIVMWYFSHTVTKGNALWNVGTPT